MRGLRVREPKARYLLVSVSFAGSMTPLMMDPVVFPKESPFLGPVDSIL